jgi:hypothetical protein
MIFFAVICVLLLFSLLTYADGAFTWATHPRSHFSDSLEIEGALARYNFIDVRTALKVSDFLLFKYLSPIVRFILVIGLGIGTVDITQKEAVEKKV